jgi:ABC-type transport system involved in multi-copper enzyme maturation permease subunit
MNNVFALAGVAIKEMYRRKDFYVLFVMTALLTLLLGAMRFFDDAEIVRFLKEICLMLIWISTLVIAVTTAARQIPAERESRTIFPLLAKPVSRWELIAGKFAGCWLACGIALAVFYFFFGVIIATHEHAWPGMVFFQAFWMHGIFLERDDLLYRRAGHSVRGRTSQSGRRRHERHRRGGRLCRLLRHPAPGMV